MNSGIINCDGKFCGKIISLFLDMLNFELLVGYRSGKIFDSYSNMYLKFNNIFFRYMGSD